MDRLSLIVLLWAASAFAVEQKHPLVPVDKETFTVLGWNKDCSVAVAHLGFPLVGDAIAADPVMTRLGAVTILPGENDYRADWKLNLDGARTWDRGADAHARADLRTAGYTLPGWREKLRTDEPREDDDDLAAQLSPATLKTKGGLPSGYPVDLRLAEIHYSPVTSSCALLLFQNRKGPPRYDAKLVRVDNPIARKERARIHLRWAMKLIDRGDRPAALLETGIAAALAPEDAPTRYHHSVQLLLDGQTEAAFDELSAAVKLDPAYKKRARDDRDYREFAWMERFQEITRK